MMVLAILHDQNEHAPVSIGNQVKVYLSLTNHLGSLQLLHDKEYCLMYIGRNRKTTWLKLTLLRVIKG